MPKRKHSQSTSKSLTKKTTRPAVKKAKPSKWSATKRSNSTTSSPSAPKKLKQHDKEEPVVYKWWKEEKPSRDGVKWKTLQHQGPLFAPPYKRLPKSVQFRYNGKAMRLSTDAEEIAGFYARLIGHKCTTNKKFNNNFFQDWLKNMTQKERGIISDLKKCNFGEIKKYYKEKSEQAKAMSKQEKLKIKKEKEALEKKHGTAVIDGHEQKIGNFRVEPPGLFMGRGNHPKMGMLKQRVEPEDVIVNCSRGRVPKAPNGRKWKEVRHDSTVTWLACWTENIQGKIKYVYLNPASRLKGEKDILKYQRARALAKHIDTIRRDYTKNFTSRDMRVRQQAVAVYLIDKLALRAGNEKDGDQADTVGCCTLRVEHIKLVDKKNVVKFNFLGKDSIRYKNEVRVDKRVFSNLKIFMSKKKKGDDLFHLLNTVMLNKHLNTLMSGLTAKVFRTYNASHIFQQQLDKLTPAKGTVAEKILAYNRANRSVAVLCNHQRAAPKNYLKMMQNLDERIKRKKENIRTAQRVFQGLKKGTNKYFKKSEQLKRLGEQLKKLEIARTDKAEGKEIALGTSKVNYLDPRITVAWCKKYDVPIDKVYNKTQRSRFLWAIDGTSRNFRFH